MRFIHKCDVFLILFILFIYISNILMGCYSKHGSNMFEGNDFMYLHQIFKYQILLTICTNILSMIWSNKVDFSLLSAWEWTSIVQSTNVNWHLLFNLLTLIDVVYIYDVNFDVTQYDVRVWTYIKGQKYQTLKAFFLFHHDEANLHCILLPLDQPLFAWTLWIDEVPSKLPKALHTR